MFPAGAPTTTSGKAPPIARVVVRRLGGSVRRLARTARRFWADVLGVIAAIVYAAPSLAYPFGFDHPIHWYIGRRLLDGEMPYAESGISTKPPGAFVVYAIADLLLSEEQWAIRIVDLLFALGIALLVVTFRPRRAQPDGRVVDATPIRHGELGAAAVIVLGFYYTHFGPSDTAHPELWQSFFMLASGWVLVRAPDFRVSARRAFASGVLACIAVTFKHVAAVTGVVAGFGVLAMALAHREPWVALRNGAVYTLGVALVLGLTFLPFVLTGTFDAFWELMVDFMLDYAQHGAPRTYSWPRWLTHAYSLYGVATCLMGVFVGLGVATATRQRRELWTGIWIAALLAGAFGSVFVQRRVFAQWGFTYHFIATVPFLALSLAWGLRRALPRSGHAQLGAAAALVACAFWFGPTWTFGHQSYMWNYRKEWLAFWDYVNGRLSFDEFHRPHQTGHFESHVRLSAVARVINARKRPGDTLCVDGFTAHVYSMTKLRCPSRFLIGDGVGNRPAWHAEYRRMLDETPPTFFLTFPDRPRVRVLTARGYTRTDITYDGATFTLLERPREAARPDEAARD